MRIPVAACLVVLAVTAATAAAGNRTRPSAPVVRGSRVVSGPVVHLQFQARERGVPARRLRFRCALDVGRLKPCASSFTARLSVGSHALRVRAVDPRGRTGPVTRVRLTVNPSGPPVKSIPVSGAPTNVVFAQDAVWATSSDGSLSRIDPATNKVSARIAAGAGQLGGVAFGDGSIWVANFDGGELDRVDPASNAVVARIPVGGQPVGPTVSGDGTVWVSNFDGSVERIDPATNTVAARIVVGGKAEATVVAFGLVWSTNNDGTIATIDPATNQVVGTRVTVDQDVDAIAPAQDGLWVCTYYAGTVAFVDPAGRQVTKHLTLGDNCSGIAYAAGSVWASRTQRGQVVKIDPTTAKIAGAVNVGSRPRDIAFGANSLWVVNEGSGTVSRIPLS
jgi:virginiamycin B lyase